MASICPRACPAMAESPVPAMKKRECPKNVEIIEPKFELTAADIHTEVVDTVKAAKKLADRSAPTSSCPLAVVFLGRGGRHSPG